MLQILTIIINAMSKIHKTEQPAEWTGIPDMPARRILFGLKPEEPEPEPSGDEPAESVADAESGRYSVTVPLAQWDYDHIVSRIIRSRYSADQMEAILNNQVADATSKHVAEFEEMQEWRKLVKRTAKEVLGIED